MCGIVSIKGRDVIKNTLESLSKLEYRGYDSCGIGFLFQGKFKNIKSLDSIVSLESLVKDYDADVCIAHTRWASKGEVNLVNTHPHLSSLKNINLVHNGNILNYQELKDRYGLEDKCVSATDSEVIVNLLEYFYLEKKNVMLSLQALVNVLEGSFSLVMMFKDFPSRLYFVKKGTPLVCLLKKDEIILSSDLCLRNDIDSFVILEDFDMGFVDEGIHVFNQNLQDKQIRYHQYDLDLINECKEDNYLDKEIREQVSNIKKMFDSYDDVVKVLNDSFAGDEFLKADVVYIVSCGSSFYAGELVSFVIEKEFKKLVKCVVASEDIVILGRPFFIFISQSGETFDVINKFKLVKGKYPYTVVVNNKYSSLAYLSDYVIDISAGKEVSVASTKAFVNEVVYLLILFYEIKGVCIKNYLFDLYLLFDLFIKKRDVLNAFVNLVYQKEHLYFLAKGDSFISAKECALKVKEVSYVHAEAMLGGELKHGSLALIDENSVVIVFVKDSDDLLMSVALNEVKSRRGFVYVVSYDDVEIDKDVSLVSVNDVFRSLGFVLFGQLLASSLGKKKLLNVDRPRNLAKSVTVE